MKPLPKGPVCPEDIPPCKCNPLGPGCQQETLQENVFLDCPGKRCKQLQLEGQDRRRKERLESMARESLESLLNQIRTRAENREVALFVECKGKTCREYRELLQIMEEYFGNARNFSLQKNPALADVKVVLRSGGENLIMEAIDVDGSIGNLDEVLAKIVLRSEVSGAEWVVVNVPAFDEDGETAPPLRYRLMRRLVTEAEYSGSGTSRRPQTNLDYQNAVQFCQKFGSDTVVPNLHAMEYALRKGVILGHRQALYEMVRITNEEDEVEFQLINWDQDSFDFERYLDQILILSWISGDYQNAKQTYFQNDMGFRCGVWEGFAD